MWWLHSFHLKMFQQMPSTITVITKALHWWLQRANQMSWIPVVEFSEVSHMLIGHVLSGRVEQARAMTTFFPVSILAHWFFLSLDPFRMRPLKNATRKNSEMNCILKIFRSSLKNDPSLDAQKSCFWETRNMNETFLWGLCNYSSELVLLRKLADLSYVEWYSS